MMRSALKTKAAPRAKPTATGRKANAPYFWDASAISITGASREHESAASITCTHTHIISHTHITEHITCTHTHRSHHTLSLTHTHRHTHITHSHTRAVSGYEHVCSALLPFTYMEQNTSLVPPWSRPVKPFPGLEGPILTSTLNTPVHSSGQHTAHLHTHTHTPRPTHRGSVAKQ